MSVAITIRNVPDDVRNELAARAARSGRSLQEYLLAQLVDMTSRPTVEEVIERAQKRARLTNSRLRVEDIISDLDADRR